MNSEEIYTDEVSFFFDSYAFFEILKSNKNYEKYKNVEIITTKLNLFELYFGILREKGETEAKEVLDLYYLFIVNFDSNILEEAAKLKNKLNKRNVSMADCIGHCTALALDIKFLTGDKEFENFNNAEFVK